MVLLNCKVRLGWLMIVFFISNSFAGFDAIFAKFLYHFSVKMELPFIDASP